MFPYEAGLTLGSIAGLVLTILVYIKVMPRKLDGTFEKPVLQHIYDFFHFKKLYLEEVLKFVYVLATITVVCIGAFMLLSYYEDYNWSYYGDSYTSKESLFFYGLLVIVGGPITLRLTYEVFMMFILLVKSTIDINNKLSKPVQTQAPVAPVAPVAPAEPVAPAAPTCSNCGNALAESDAFCTACGHRR